MEGGAAVGTRWCHEGITRGIVRECNIVYANRKGCREAILVRTYVYLVVCLFVFCVSTRACVCVQVRVRNRARKMCGNTCCKVTEEHESAFTNTRATLHNRVSKVARVMS